MSGHSNALRACLVALNAYPAIDPQAAGPVGGIETRAWTFARGLAQRDDWDVSLFVRHSRPPTQTQFDGVALIPFVDRLYSVRQTVRLCIGKQRQFPWLTLHRWRAALLWQFPLVAAERLIRGIPGDPWRVDARLANVDADVFCTFGVQTHSATVIASARATNRPAVLFLGSDGDLDENYSPDSSYVSPYGDRGDVCWRILQEADSIIAQTGDQQRLLRERFGRDSVLIENPIDVRSWDAGMTRPIDDIDFGLDRYVLWVGRAEDVHKRPRVCLELAGLCPDVNFLMVLNPRDPVVEDRTRREAPGNVRILTFVPFSQMPAVFAHAAALVNTSSLEGFPNVFLQAAVSRVPITSLNVGESFLNWLGAGCYAAGDLLRLADFLKQVWERAAPTPDQLDRARARVIERYGVDARIEAFAGVLREATASTPP